jgi:hypothetical protein
MKEKAHHRYNWLPLIGLIAIDLLISTTAVSKQIRSIVQKRAKEKNNGCCEICGKKPQKKNGRLIIAHFNHSKKSPHYNNPKEVAAACLFCEAEIHVRAVKNPQSIGMKKQDNLSAAWGRCEPHRPKGRELH